MAAPRSLARHVASLSSRSCRVNSVAQCRSFTCAWFPSLYSNAVSNRRPTAHTPLFLRNKSTYTRPPSSLTDSTPATSEDSAQNEARRAEEPAYLITFTCKPCSHRSGHRISKHGYHKGTVLITCPNCKNRHIISDHLNIFMDTKSTLEDILAKKGQSLKKVTLGEGDTELWPQQPSDGAETDSLKPLEDTKGG
ncbi:hypothetical protein LOZ53_006346 [Ophidiomyces ophidiicola]|uniref:uncharacterized protein n=1 Tax=Ophidiomyces ophidiicola TaxID=1387563 RepID=UPI0020C1CE75|nr:uncharacterized protein LOZ57_006549 [Ophidiomyces ophidiicola]KAI1913273.1 hypothetical protein LOZ61_002807 [Ophidiomyces ophidiicola]KAI1931014.1 hypothetical protein LOZ60_000448 [Ophidiomyces ophidiicola]KAI1937769.1 hypothetical protein LOZ57_006549 [Ophidiomyces ophidiicola]KAI1979253.1 hypothetical protein LOZ55_002077 [Ophidiomyces ophidiicola]KAI1982086.1 hypothetical protein LOZ53_006346 [Ophidiomyces ophidiicola]